jgi:hypothetical protein
MTGEGVAKLADRVGTAGTFALFLQLLYAHFMWVLDTENR